MRVKEEEAGVPRVTIFISYEVKGHVVLATSNANILFNFEELADLLKILRLDRIKPESHGYQHEN